MITVFQKLVLRGLILLIESSVPHSKKRSKYIKDVDEYLNDPYDQWV